VSAATPTVGPCRWKALMGFAFPSTDPAALAGGAAAQKTIDLVGVVSVWHGTGSEGLRARSAGVSTR
jgi:hypothetical protein